MAETARAGSLWLHDALDYWAQVDPQGEFVTHGDRSLTYAEARRRVDRMAGALVRDLAPAARLSILSKNSIEMILLYYAASKAGVVPVPLNYRLAPAELQYILEDSGAALLLAQSEYVDPVDSIRDECSRGITTIAMETDPPRGWQYIEDWLADPLPAEQIHSRRHDEALQIYTSGTTGRPKGAVLTHAQLDSLLHQWRICYPFSQGERLLVVAPLYHVGGAFHSFHAIGHGGAVLLYTDFDADEVVRALDEDRVGMAFLVPAMIQSCLAVPGVEKRDFESFRLLSYGASPISEGTLRKAIELFDCDFVQSFGMTECPCITYLTPADHRRALEGRPELLESTGRAGPGSQVKIVGPDDEELAAGEIGEILGRGPQVMRGYWNLPEASAEALRGGWMHTGDAGVLDEEGYLYVRDRIKDMIVSGAENVYPREVESVLLTHPAVDDVAVVGVPHERWGETVKAIVVVRDGVSATEDELIDFCRGKLAGYKRPTSVDFIGELPRNPSGKVLKRVLREPYWAGQGRRVS